MKMKPESFVYWLQGFAELTGERPSAAQWEVIKLHLQAVFEDVIVPKPQAPQVAPIAPIAPVVPQPVPFPNYPSPPSVKPDWPFMPKIGDWPMSPQIIC